MSPNISLFGKQFHRDGQRTSELDRISRRAFNAAIAGAALYPYLSTLAEPYSVGEAPITVDPQSIAYLMADRADRSPDLVTKTDETGGFVKRFWVQDWKDSQQHFRWTVDVEKGGMYGVTIMLSAPPGTELEINGPANTVHFVWESAHPEYFGFNWNRVALPAPLSLPRGHSVISIRMRSRPLTGHIDAALKSLEILSTEARPALDARVRAFRSDTRWLNEAKFGFMCQCGEWSYPRQGPHKAWPEMVESFDVDGFVDTVDSTGAGYAIWSATWATYFFPAPIKAIDAILPGRTSKRDLIGEIANKLADKNIRLLLYYHVGHGDSEWWARNWISPYDKTLFVKNWCSIIDEVGRRYGDRLAGWMFDDELVYYPAPYEQLGAAAKAGNSSRIISYNPWIQPRGTDFQDFQFGEGFRGSADLGVSAHGIWRDGPMQGLHAHGNFQLDGPDWGINKPDTVIEPPLFSPEQALQMALDAAARDEALSWNLLMYDDGSVSSESLRLLQSVGRVVRKQYPRSII